MKTEAIKTRFDAKKAEAFSEKLLDMVNGGTLSLMISVGHRTGLFDTMSKLEHANLHEIAQKSGLQQRYVKEWLGSMVTGEIVEYDEKAKTYYLPPENAAFLTRAAGADNFGVFAQYISVLGGVEDDIVSCFSKGGGVPYEKFHRFHEVMAEDSLLSVGTSLFDHILPLIPGIEKRLENGIRVMDLGCGKGLSLMKLAERFPKSSFSGLDLCEEPIVFARNRANAEGLDNIWFEVADLTHYEPESQYDFITAFDAIHDQARPDKVLEMVCNSLKPDGVFLMQDIFASSHLEKNMDHPLSPLLYTISTMHCMTVSLAQGGMGLGTMWGVEKADEMLREAGFREIEIHRLDHDIQNAYFVVRK